MMALIIYIGLFVWGMNCERLTWRVPAVLIAIMLVQIGMGWLLLGIGELIRTGALSLASYIGLTLLDVAINTAIFFIGYAIGGYRRRKSAPDDVADTFS